jgi:hypothetical protein
MSFLIAQADKPLLVWMFDAVGLNYLLFIVPSVIVECLFIVAKAPPCFCPCPTGILPFRFGG